MKTMERLSTFLKKQNVKYELITHPVAYTAQETAAAEHVSGKQLAKVVMLKADGRNLMAVLPAASQLSISKFKQLVGAKEVRLATEQEFKELFPDCEVGAMPPFGDLYEVPFFVDMALADNPFIVFNAGTHRDTVRMRYRDYAKIAQPDLVEFKAETV
ncbi:MAG: deacylase [Omnitrophica bacterium RIFCSPHIGHO2_02_FULL_51_18]|nr:MAG: deacylase [Omnitrophica bacterium RIFCSPHIGHO2_02_FULL_51_18]